MGGIGPVGLTGQSPHHTGNVSPMTLSDTAPRSSAVPENPTPHLCLLPITATLLGDVRS